MRSTEMTARFLAAALLAITVAAVGARQAPERTLVVDFYALGSDGSSVADLKPEELSVKVDGRTRAVRSLRLVRQADPPAADPLAAAAAVPEPFSTNRGTEAGRSFIIVVEDESFRPGRERPIRSAVKAFLGEMTSKDRVSVWTVPHGGIKVNLTGNFDRVAAAIDQVNGHGPDQESGSDAACRTRDLCARPNRFDLLERQWRLCDCVLDASVVARHHGERAAAADGPAHRQCLEPLRGRARCDRGGRLQLSPEGR